QCDRILFEAAALVLFHRGRERDDRVLLRGRLARRYLPRRRAALAAGARAHGDLDAQPIDHRVRAALLRQQQTELGVRDDDAARIALGGVEPQVLAEVLDRRVRLG